MLVRPGDRVSTPTAPSVRRKRNSVLRAGADAFRREAHSHFAVAHLEVQGVSAPASLEGADHGGGVDDAVEVRGGDGSGVEGGFAQGASGAVGVVGDGRRLVVSDDR